MTGCRTGLNAPTCPQGSDATFQANRLTVTGLPRAHLFSPHLFAYFIFREYVKQVMHAPTVTNSFRNLPGR
jgi:hypothetical protein